MAKAYFNCTKCGASTMVVGRNRSEADRLAKYRTENGGLCPDCYSQHLADQRAEQSQKAAEDAAIAGLPVLHGTEKQIAWAETLRAAKVARLAEIEKFIADSTEDWVAEVAPTLADGVQLLRAQDSAQWWIEEGRHIDLDFGATSLLRFLAGDGTSPRFIRHGRDQLALMARQHMGGLRRSAIQDAPAAVVDAAKAESTVRPESPKTEAVAEVRATDTALEITFPEKNDHFRSVVKEELHCQWINGRWFRPLTTRTGRSTDRAAEAGHRLLAAGFVVRIFDEEARSAAVAGSYEPECRRWISLFTDGKNKGRLAVKWYRPDDFYAVAARLPGAHWDRDAHAMAVPATSFEELQDFAEAHGFQITDLAVKAMDEARLVKEASLTARVPAPAKKKAARPAVNPQPLQTPESVEVDDDLRDS